MITKKLQLPRLFNSIRCEITKTEEKNVQNKLFSHYCPNCDQVFIARFDWRNSGLALRWNGLGYRCPTCGQVSYSAWEESSKYYSDIGMAVKTGKPIPVDMNLSLYEFNEKIKLSINANAVYFNPKNPETVEKTKIQETITFDTKTQRTYFKQTQNERNYYKNNEQTSKVETEIQNPLDNTFFENSMLNYLRHNSRPWRENKHEIAGLLKEIREMLNRKIRKTKGYKANIHTIPFTKKDGMMLFQISNMAWQLAATDAPNLKEFYKQSRYEYNYGTLETCHQQIPNVTKEEIDSILEKTTRGKSYPQAILESFHLPDTKSGRRMAAKKDLVTLSILKVLAETNLDEQGRKLFWDCMINNWNNCRKKASHGEYYINKTLPNKNGLDLFVKAVNKTGQSKALQLMTKLPVDMLNDAGDMYITLTQEEKEEVWYKATSAKKIHDTCTEMNWRHKHPDYNLDVPEHIVNRLMMQKDHLRFYLPETYHQLHAAGKELNNCVGGSYPSMMKEGRCCIVLVADDMGKLKVCVELRKNNIVQAKLFDNRPTYEDTKLNKIILDWAKEKKLKINTDDIVEYQEQNETITIAS